LNIAHASADVDVFDVQGGTAHLSTVHHAVRQLALHDMRTTYRNIVLTRPCSGSARIPLWWGPGIVV
jgi:hypothetical protein